jgi:CCR4-NOT transcription complex subunit 2
VAGGAAAASDRYGLLGLLQVIRMTDQDLTMLALGTDLTSLGLNLNSPEQLYKSMVSPLSDAPLRREPGFEVRGGGGGVMWLGQAMCSSAACML